jgi:hypothetical protein
MQNLENKYEDKVMKIINAYDYYKNEPKITFTTTYSKLDTTSQKQLKKKLGLKNGNSIKY